MKLVSTLTAVRFFFQGLLDESPHSLAFAIQHWDDGVFDDDPGLPNALQSMSTAVSNILEQLNLAQIIRGENEGVLGWLKDLKDAAYAADNLLSELDYYRLHQQADEFKARSRRRRRQRRRRRLRLFPTDEDQASTSSHKDSRYNIVRRMNENVCRLGTITAALSSVLSLLKLVVNFRPNPHDFPVASHRITTSFSSSKQTVLGRDSEKDQIIKLLLLPTPTSVSMIPIVGMGGIGKTTLAKMVYNHEEIERHFDRKIWVCVSDNFDVARLTKEMLEGLGVHDGFDHTTSVDTLQQILMKNLQSLKYLLVLDDVWNDSEEDKWGSLCAVLQSQKAGSRILMTTRLHPVVNIAAKNMDMLDQCQLGGLPEEKFLSLFNICAFGDKNPRDYLSLEIIGEQIAARLKGSPLAAKTVGGLLRENLDEDHWRSILNSDIWQLPQIHDDIMPVLQLSYQHLAPSLQQCFIYCCIFPKDHEFDKNYMVAMWISNGYIRTKYRGNKSVEEIGSEYFDNLLSRSFIQASDLHTYASLNGHLHTYVLHDLLHDLAKSVLENEHLQINLGETKEITSSVRHLYVDYIHLSVLKSCNLRNLRTLIIHGCEVSDDDNGCEVSDDDNVLKEVLNGLKNIRVLSLEDVPVEKLSGSIGHLIHLRYLAVKCDYENMPPDSQCRPYHLQWLICKGGYFHLPAATNYLVSLRHLLPLEHDISVVSGFGKLTCLQELDGFVVEKTEARKLSELKRLNELKGILSLSCLEDASAKEALEASLNKKVGIRELHLSCFDYHETPQMAEEVFEGLCPPPYIQKLRVAGYVGVESPTWMMTVNCCLSVLQSLTLTDCSNWKVLPPLGQLPLLRHLTIYEAHAVEEIGSSFYGAGAAETFPCLETLEFRDMREWVVWSGANGDTDSLFPRLRELTVLSCPKLKRVPMQCLASVEVLKTNCMVLLGELASIEELSVKNCDQLSSLFTTETETKLPSLREITISRCRQLSSLFTTETETKLPSLRERTISGCRQLVSVELKSLPSLQKLRIRKCYSMQSVPLLPATLEELEIWKLPMLTAFSREQEENLSDLPSLRKIKIEYCYKLHSLPLMPASLQRLYISECPELPRKRYQEGGDDWHKTSHVPDIYVNGYVGYQEFEELGTNLVETDEILRRIAVALAEVQGLDPPLVLSRIRQQLSFIVQRALAEGFLIRDGT